MASNLFLRKLAKRGKDITLQDRSIVEPIFNEVDFDENFSSVATVKAVIDTVRGKTFFDGVSTERVITHEIRILFISGVTAETWILFSGRRLDILNVENCCEEDDVLVLTCSDIGTGEAAKT